MQRFVIILTLFFVLSPWARAESIALILNDDSPPFREFASQLEETLRGSDWRIKYRGSSRQNTPNGKFDLIITAGGEALRSILNSNPRSPVLATLITEANFRTLLTSQRVPVETSAIVLDQPPHRQTRLIRLMFPEAKQIGMLFSPQTASQRSSFLTELNRQTLQLQSEIVSSEEQVVPAIDQLLARGDLLLAHPDTAIYSRNTIKPIFITAYRHRRPVVAFSATLAKAGAVVALYSTPTQIGEQTGQHLLNRFKPDNTILYPKRFSLDINQSVAESFGLRLPEANELLQRLMMAEKP